MNRTPIARAEMVFSRPVEQVRGFFFDVANLIRTQPFHATVLEWASPGPSGETRVRYKSRLFERTTEELVSIEQGPSGEWIRRYQDGPNNGASLEVVFEGCDEGAKLVMYAYSPSGVLRSDMGKLSTAGIESLLRRTLEDYRRAVEGYPPDLARRRIRRILVAMADVLDPLKRLPEANRNGAVATVLEAACALSLADGEADPVERAVFDEVAVTVTAQSLTDDVRGRMVESAAKSYQRGMLSVRCESIGQRLKTLGAASAGLTVAAVVAEVSRGIEDVEMMALRRMASAAGVPDPELAQILARVEKLVLVAMPRRSQD